MTKEYIRNCSWGYSCEQFWEVLDDTQDPQIKFCNDCQKEVHRCETKEELVNNIAMNRCVNFPSTLTEIFDEAPSLKSEQVMLTGFPIQRK